VLTNGKGSRAPANWQAAWVVKNLMLPLQILGTSRPILKLNEETATWGCSAHRRQQAAEPLSKCESRYGTIYLNTI